MQAGDKERILKDSFDVSMPTGTLGQSQERHQHWRVMINRRCHMYAIIATGGKQYKVAEGDIITIEKLGMNDGDAVTFDQVLAVNNGKLSVGSPVVKGATVTGSVVREGRAKKVIVYKYKRKSGYHKKNGHRQPFTQVKIEKINA
jgi:large subunit ribosomal protein L21